jgi:hypothetical protein
VYAAGHGLQAGARRREALERPFCELAALRAREFIFGREQSQARKKKIY